MPVAVLSSPLMGEEDLEDDDFGLAASEEPDPLDADNFNSVEYINRQFPNEASLGGLDDFVEKLKARQKHNDEDIRLAIRRQAATGRRARADLDEAKSAVRELFERIKAIKAKAEQSEELVSDVCRDIKSLDIAKRNLTLTVTALKRLVMLVTALEQLRTLGSCRKYEEASRLIHAVDELAGHFRELNHVNRVADLLEKKSAILDDLKQQLMDDYVSVLGGPVRHELPDDWGTSAAFCVDALGPAMRREVVTQFCLRILEDYKDIFQPPKEASGLETAERRFSWLDRMLHKYEEKYASVFPELWRVPCSLCEHFCHVTRQHLVEILSTSHHTVDPELMVRVLRKSIDYENKLARKYPVDDLPAKRDVQPDAVDYTSGAVGFGLKYPDVLGKAAKSQKQSAADAAADNAQFAPRFRGIISECFDAYLSSWVQHEERQLLEVLAATGSSTDKITTQYDESHEDEDEGGSGCLYASAPSLFAAMKMSMNKCSGFSTHNTLFDVFKVFQKVMAQYVDKLSKRLPDRITAPLDASTVKAVCCVIGTAEYCDETMPVFAEQLLRVISSEFEDRVTFSQEQELLGNLMHRANQVLVQSVNCSLDESFMKMNRTNWEKFAQEVGDHSAYVGEISEQLSKHFAPVAASLSKIHYRFFCDKFVQTFVKRYIEEIYKCKKISEQGAQQLLLDTTLIKTTLLETPVVAGNGGKMQTAYSNYVLREMGRAETMLKVLSSPDVVDASSVIAMLGDDRPAAEISRLLALRATADGEHNLFAGNEDDRYGSSNMTAIGSTMKNFGDSLNQTGLKASEDLKKNFMDMKKNVHKLGFSGVNLPSFGGRKAGSSSGAPQ